MYPSECNEENHLFFNDTATTEIYTLSLHDALPICTAGHRATPLASSSVYHDGEQARPGQHPCSRQPTRPMMTPIGAIKANQSPVTREYPTSFFATSTPAYPPSKPPRIDLPVASRSQ